MSQRYRLHRDARIDRQQTIRFRYDNKAYTGLKGDTLASALLANGVHRVGRSFKYHRPRGIYSAGSEEPNALVQLETGAYTEPNRRATEIELYEGLTAASQNCWPSPGFDLGAINNRISRILPAGFYYKTFMWPASLWMTYERFIRKAAGLGKSPMHTDPDCYDKLYTHCDLLIVGGGPAGLSAALAAGRAGARVLLIDEKHELGGSLLSEQATINGEPAVQWVESCVAQLREMKNVDLLIRTTVAGYYDYNFLVGNERVSEHLGPQGRGHRPKERLWKIRARHVILATGAIERPLVFADSDRPGIMLASAVRSYLNRFAVLAGENIVFITNNDSAYHSASECREAGAAVTVLDTRLANTGPLAAAARRAGIRVMDNATISAVKYRRGRVAGVAVMSLASDGKSATGRKTNIECDLVGVAGGWTPTLHLFSQAGGSLQYLPDQHCFVADQMSVNNACSVAGACNARFSLNECLAEGAETGQRTAAALGFSSTIGRPDTSPDPGAESPMRPLWILPCDHPVGQGPKKHFHELHNDSTVADIHMAAREGFASVEHLKRYTTTGMGTDQGKISNLNALAVLADIRGMGIPEVGTTTFRPPYTPLTLGAIAGHDRRELFLQTRKTAMHPWHDKHGAVYEDVGDWKRPYYYAKAGEAMQAAVRRECLAVRQACGLLDASTLGKIDLQGKDTVWLLDMLYTNAWRRLQPGRCRYGLMLNEHGMVFDDGVITCLAENHYHMTTTTGGAARVMAWIEEWLQTEWPEKEVYATSVTEQWAVASLNGPNAARVLSQVTDLPLDDESFPSMSMREAAVAGIAARIFRISFSGEPAFEINVPARYGLALWEALVEAGEPYGLCPYGTEAMHVLRAEKGFIIVGQDTDGTVTPMDLGMDWIVSGKKPDFLGRRSLHRTDTARDGRKQLVGLLTENPEFVIPEGAHVVREIKDTPPMAMLGHVSSSYMSPNVGRSIAMALLKDGFRLKGKTLYVALIDGVHQRVTVTDPVFLP